MDKTVVIFINYSTLGVRSQPSGPKRKYWGRLISSHSASGEPAEEPAVPAAGAPSSAGAAGAAGGDAVLGATPGLSQSPETAARRVPRAPTDPRRPPLPSLPHRGTRSFTYTQTHKQHTEFIEKGIGPCLQELTPSRDQEYGTCVSDGNISFVREISSLFLTSCFRRKEGC